MTKARPPDGFVWIPDRDDGAWYARPIATVLKQLRPLCNTYSERRADLEPDDAFWESLEVTLTPKEFEDVEDFISGNQDNVYGAETGSEFWYDFLDRLEKFHDTISPERAKVAEAEERNDRLARMDILAYAETVALDNSYARMFCSALDSGKNADVEEMITVVCRAILEKASQAHTRTGQRIKIDQARTAFQKIGKKASARSGVDAANRAKWCYAVAHSLRNL